MPPKKMQLLQTAEPLFRAQGIRRVTVEEVCTQAGVSKVTFYKYFANRNALALAVLERLIQRSAEETHALLHADLPFLDRFKALLAYKHSMIEDWGPALIADIMSHPSPEILALFQAAQTASEADTAKFLAEGYASGALNPAIPEAVVSYLMHYSRTWFNEPGFVSVAPDPQVRAHLMTTLLMTGICQHPVLGGEP